MADFWRLVIRDDYFVVRRLAIEANNFELKPALINVLAILVKTPMSIWGYF